MAPSSRRADSSTPKNRDGVFLFFLALLILIMLSRLAHVADVGFLALLRIQFHTVVGAACLTTMLVSSMPVPIFFVPVRETPEGSGPRKTS